MKKKLLFFILLTIVTYTGYIYIKKYIQIQNSEPVKIRNVDFQGQTKQPIKQRKPSIERLDACVAESDTFSAFTHNKFVFLSSLLEQTGHLSFRNQCPWRGCGTAEAGAFGLCVAD